MNFEKYPFEKLRELLKGIEPEGEIIDLTIGEPQFPTPTFIQDAFKESSELLRKYPKSGGEEFLRNSMIGFFQRRFGVKLENENIIPTFGTREVLFNFPQFYLFDKPNPKIAFTNPFYQIYEGSAIASRAEIVYINLEKENNFQPVIDEKYLDGVDLVILNFPNNPTGATLSFEEMKRWIELSQKYGFTLLNDECYSEIYTDTPPLSLLEVAHKIGITNFQNLLVVNSISKRSSAPGLRSGFIAGDSSILKNYMRYRTYTGTAIPLPLQIASSKGWSDDSHVEENRKIYRRNMEIAQEILGVSNSATFYLWLEVEDDLKTAIELYRDYNIKVIPGRFLGRQGAGKNFIRIALVERPERVRQALEKIRNYLKG
ncbi:MAG TPA: succinyldiaminopimelate transaminase [Campylobacterales bacterium]|nr:succinyldiaminopimelate transaminase [Campylobacterales bacterium]